MSDSIRPRRRFLSRADGSFNVTRKGMKRKHDFYHRLLSIGWGRFFAVMAAGYLALITIFALAFFAMGPNALSGFTHPGFEGRFRDCFFFSVHTLATIGYGSLSPQSLGANLLVVVEAFTGLSGIAIMTGLLFSRFSRPTARIVFSDKAIIRDRKGVRVFMFRMANERLNQVARAEVEVVVSLDETTPEGETGRVFLDLKLQRSRSPFFAMTWTVIHPIDRDSPFFGLDREQLRSLRPEILVSFMGLDDTFSQTIHTRFSYVADDIVWGGQYKDIVGRDERDRIKIDLESIHEVVGGSV